MATRTKPEPESESAAPDPAFFTFTDSAGVAHTMPNRTVETLNVGFARRNRHRDTADYTFVVIESLAGDGPEAAEILDAVDNMKPEDWIRFNRELNTHIGASRGE